MSMDDGQFLDDRHDTRDDELDGALEVLKQLPQSTVAYKIGISERRLRDIEHRRSYPRQKTRDAILRLAQEVSEGKPSAAPSTFGSESIYRGPAAAPFQWQPLQASTGFTGYAGLVGFGILVISIVIGAVLGSGSQE